MNFAALLDLEKTPSALPYDARAYDLEGFREWLAAFGHPERGQAFVHIAGTKGKGSTAALTEAMLLSLGYNTATFTSPHLAHFGERYRYNGVAWTLAEFEQAVDRLNSASQPPWRDALKAPHRFRTAFEFMTMVALLEFSRRGTQLQAESPARRQVVCWETGLGGRLDCTNVVEPLVSVITTLGLDHTAILGDTIEKIASEKAGIIKPGRPVVIARQQPEFADRVLPVLLQRAREVNAPVWMAAETCPVLRTVETAMGQHVEFALPDGSRHAACLPLRGGFQQTNLEAALTATWSVERELAAIARALKDLGQQLARGIAECRWAGRLELNRSANGQALVLDGAHCPLSAGAVAEAVKCLQESCILPTAAPLEVLWGMQRDKQHRQFLEALVGHAGRERLGTIHTYCITGVRGAEADALAKTAQQLGLPARSHASAREALSAAAATGHDVLAVGTLYTIAELREHWSRITPRAADI